MPRSMDEGELARLRAENQRLTTLLDAVSDVLILVGVDDGLQYTNRAGREQLEELTGVEVRDVFANVVLRSRFPADLSRSIDDAKERTRASGFVAEEILLPLRSGARWYEHKLTAIRDERGECQAFAVISRDIHERVLAREELAGALAFREQIIGILGHDMRNPLSAISALATLTLRRADVPADVRTRLEQMELAALRTLEMIETLLDFTESRFRKTFKISRARSDLRVICREVVAEISAAEPHRHIELSIQGDGHADCDPARIAQVVSNLLANALTHGDKSENVQLLIDGRRDHVVIAVTNRGIPISDELGAVLFEPFRRRPDALDRPRGLGLGLFIAQQIVSAHGGKIAVSSSAEAGTCFSVSLPRSDPAISAPIGAS
jgi:sigma-B regulation protein RsbU (phosphoserine phosphatase)